jgi:hypothetical protein
VKVGEGMVPQVDRKAKVTESEARALPKRELLVRIATDTLFSLSFFFLFFCISYGLSSAGKSWGSAPVIIWRLVVLLLISSATVCSLIFALHSAFEFFKSFRIVHIENCKT